MSSHANPDIRLAAAWALGRTGNAGHADHLALAQLDSDTDVSEMAGRALAMLRRRLD
jgi:HEAT repeat protein